MRVADVVEKPGEVARPGDEKRRSPGFDSGERIPFRIRIGVAGHRELAADPKEAVYRAFDSILNRLPDASFDAASPVTDVRLAVVSELAEGGDRTVPRHAFGYAAERGEDARLEVVLPMERGQYA